MKGRNNYFNRQVPCQTALNANPTHHGYKTPQTENLDIIHAIIQNHSTTTLSLIHPVLGLLLRPVLCEKTPGIAFSLPSNVTTLAFLFNFGIGILLSDFLKLGIWESTELAEPDAPCWLSKLSVPALMLISISLSPPVGLIFDSEVDGTKATSSSPAASLNTTGTMTLLGDAEVAGLRKFARRVSCASVRGRYVGY